LYIIKVRILVDLNPSKDVVVKGSFTESFTRACIYGRMTGRVLPPGIPATSPPPSLFCFQKSCAYSIIVQQPVGYGRSNGIFNTVGFLICLCHVTPSNLCSARCRSCHSPDTSCNFRFIFPRSFAYSFAYTLTEVTNVINDTANAYAFGTLLRQNPKANAKYDKITSLQKQNLLLKIASASPDGLQKLVSDLENSAP